MFGYIHVSDTTPAPEAPAPVSDPKPEPAKELRVNKATKDDGTMALIYVIGVIVITMLGVITGHDVFIPHLPNNDQE